MRKIILIQLSLLLYIGLLSQPSINETKTKWYKLDNPKNNQFQINKLDKFQLGFGNNDELIEIRTNVDSKGNQHIRYTQEYKGIPIWNSLLISHWNKGYLNTVNGNFISNLKLNTQPKISKNDARNQALQYIKADYYAWHSTEAEEIIKKCKKRKDATFFPEGNLCIYAPDFDAKEARLAYEFDIFSLQPLRKVKLLLDARTGEILTEIDEIHCADGTDEDTIVDGSGKTLYNNESYANNAKGGKDIKVTSNADGSSHRLESDYVTTKDGSPQPFPDSIENFVGPTGIHIENNSSDTDFGNIDSTAISAHWASEQWFEYMENSLNWHGYDNQGGSILNVVHFGDSLANAFTNGVWISYGDGKDTTSAWVSIDIVAHEITHELIRSTANLIYQGESGAINESFADIFGIMVERHALDTNFNWTIGEDITKSGEGFRTFKETMIYRDTSTGWYNGLSDHGGVHTNNAVQNHWFYRLSNEIGIDTAAQICFHSLTNYLTPFSDYHDARNASIQAALDLYDETIAQAVCLKWLDVGVGDSTCLINDVLVDSIRIIDSSDSILIANNDFEITWTDSGNIDSVGLSYCEVVDGDTICNTIVDGWENDSIYTWTVSEINTTSDSIYMIVHDASNYAVADTIGPLTIIECPAMADFTPPVDACLGNIINLNADTTDNIVDASHYEWIINGDTTIIGSNISWTANDIGFANIELVVYNSIMSCTSSFTQEVFVSDSSDQVAMFNCQRNSNYVFFTASNIDPNASYSWTIGGNHISNAPNIGHKFDSIGLYDVCLTVTNACSDTFEYCKSVAIFTNEGSPNLCDTSWDFFTESDSLPNGDSVRALLEDSSGNIWIATYGGGLVKVDPSGNWEFISGSENNINAILEGNDGRIYLGTHQGLQIYDEAMDSFEQYKEDNSNLPSNIIWSLAKDDSGDIWLGTGVGLVSYDGMDFISSSANSTIRTLLIDANTIWLGTMAEGLMKFNINSNIVEDTLNTSDTSGDFNWPNNEIRSLHISTDRILWIGTQTNGLIKYNLENDSFEVDSTPDFNRIWDIEEDGLGNIYFGTVAGGVKKYNPETMTIKATYDSSIHPMLGSAINALLITEQGVLWVGTVEGVAISHSLEPPSFQVEHQCNGQERDSTLFIGESYGSIETEWQINGDIVSNSPNLSYYFESSGTYEVTLITTSSDGCKDVYWENVNIPAFASELEELYPDTTQLCIETEESLILNPELYHYTSYAWFKDGSITSTGDSLVITEAGTYKLEVIDTCGKIVERTFIVGDYEDCVWPGDTNKDGWVNSKDLLNIGLYYGDTGAARNDNTSTWLPYAVVDWGSDSLEMDLKHVDANGDGTINDLDKQVVMDNFGKNRGIPYLPSIAPLVTPYSLVPVFEGINPVTNELEISVKIVSNEGFDLSYYGISFTLAYHTPSSGIDTLFRPLYLQSDLVGEDAISLRYQGLMRFNETGDMVVSFTSIAVSGTNHLDRLASPNAGTIQEYNLANFTIGDEIDMPGGDSGVYLKIIPMDILMVNSQGDTIPINAQEMDIYLPDDNYNFIASVLPLNCQDEGKITLLPIDTSEVYSYSWNTGSTANIIHVHSEGTYTVTVTDSGGITDSFEIFVEDNSVGLSLDTIMNTSNDTACIHPLGGNGNYLYYWDDESNTSCIPVLSGSVYTVTVVDGNGCSASKTISIDITSPITEPESENESINIYPNPTSDDVLFVEYDSNSNSSLDMKILDISGRFISSQKETVIQGLNNFEINIKDIPKGIYILHFNNNGQIDNHRFTIID